MLCASVTVTVQSHPRRRAPSRRGGRCSPRPCRPKKMRPAADHKPVLRAAHPAPIAESAASIAARRSLSFDAQARRVVNDGFARGKRGGHGERRHHVRNLLRIDADAPQAAERLARTRVLPPCTRRFSPGSQRPKRRQSSTHARSPCTESGRRPRRATGPADRRRRKEERRLRPVALHAVRRRAVRPARRHQPAARRLPHRNAEAAQHLHSQVDVALRFERRRQHDLRIAVKPRQREQQPRNELGADVARQAVFAACSRPRILSGRPPAVSTCTPCCGRSAV